MDANLAMKFVTEYASRIERIRYVERRISVRQDQIKDLEKRIADLRAEIDTMNIELANETAHRDEAHAFALSAIKSLTPARGFVV